MARRPQNPLSTQTTYFPLMEERHPELLRNRGLLDHIIRDVSGFHLIENGFPGRVFPDIPTALLLIANDGINFLQFILPAEDLPKRRRHSVAEPPRVLKVGWLLSLWYRPHTQP